MEIDNIQINNVHKFSQQVINPKPNYRPNYCDQFRQDQRRLVDKRDVENNYDQIVENLEQKMEDGKSGCNFFSETASDYLSIINIRIKGEIYKALIDTGANISLIDNNINEFQKHQLTKPIQFSTINNKDVIKYEVLTDAPDEFSIQHYSKIRWKVTDLRERRYTFIIGIDLLNSFKTLINLDEGYISINDKITNFLIKK